MEQGGIPLFEKEGLGEILEERVRFIMDLSVEALAKLAISAIPESGNPECLKNWIPVRALLARNDDFLHFSRVFQEAQL
jgi:hypothetical protein